MRVNYPTRTPSAAVRDVLQENPKLGAQLSLAETWFRLNEPSCALPHAQRAAELMEERGQTHVLIVEILDDLGRTFEMPEPLEAAIERDPESSDAHILLAYAHVSSGQLDEAAEPLEWCLQHRPNDVDALHYSAIRERNLGNHVRALHFIRSALASDPDHLECRLLEADCLMYDSRANETYERLIPLFGRYQTAGEYLGTLIRAAVISGRREKALECQQLLKQVMLEEDEQLTEQ